MHAQRFGYDGPTNEKPSIFRQIVRQMAISFLRQPVQTSGLIVMGVASITIMANALYFQPGMHPAPFFSQKAPQQIAALTPITKVPVTAPIAVVKSVTPILRPNLDGAEKRVASAPEVAPQAKTRQKFDLSNPQGNKAMYEIQTLLAQLGFFNKTRDGYYGPNTANAIRAFQKSSGLEQTGELSDMLKVQLYTAIEGGAVAPTKVATIEPTPIKPVAPVAKVLPVPTIPAVKVPVASVKPVARKSSNPAVAPGPLELAALLAKSVEEALPAMGENVASAVAQVAQAVGVEPATRKVTTRKIQPVAKLTPSQAMPAPAVQRVETVAKVEPVIAEVRPQSQALVESIQRGLLSLGYLHGEVDGVAGDATATAIRQFENDNSFPITGAPSAHMLTLLIAAKADIS